MLSNGVTNIDSVTKFEDYVSLAKSYGMTALGGSEHGSVFMHAKRKDLVEAAGMKYVHSIEAYITMTLEEKIRDSYHCILIAKNYEGFKEINRLVSSSFKRRNDNHFYYVPRISMSELERTSDNIIVTSACLGGILNSNVESHRERFLRFAVKNSHRVYLEIQHHCVSDQMNYNMMLWDLAIEYDLKLIAGTDTHSLNETHAKGRAMLQKGKGVRFEDEDGWDLVFKSYDELCEAYRRQGVLPEAVWLEAIENTNEVANQIEPFKVGTSIKYPNVFEDPDAEFESLVMSCIDTHPFALKNHSREALVERVQEELDTYKTIGATPYMLLKYRLSQWEKQNGINIGYGRGSVSGSMIAYLLGVTDMDSVRFDLNFSRFLNRDRVSVADIDSDYTAKDRDRVKRFLLEEHMGYPQINAAEIITFNTIATKGAIRDIGRAFEYSYDVIDGICKTIDEDGNIPSNIREEYPELFEYVDIVIGTIVSIGSHPCGILISDRNIEEEIGLCTTSGSEYPVTCLYMKELDKQNWVKWDILGLDNVTLINDTCKLLGIERLTPDNVDLEDMNVWRSIRDDTTLIFQWESESAGHYIKQFMSDEVIKKARMRDADFSMLKWMSFGNGLLRPACASYRDDVAAGNVYDNGLKELNDFLSKEAGHVCMQETIMKWLVNFCGYSQAESDTVRRGIAKKVGTEDLLPEIERRFIEYSSEKYNIPKEKCEEIIKPFLQVIIDASSYAFSWNHSDAYSCIGYICGYLRYYYPLEFLTVALNVFASDREKTIRITEYANKRGIKVLQPKFGFSGADYQMVKEQNVIYKGLSSIKYIGEDVANALYEMKDSMPDTFIAFLKITPCDSRQLRILTSLNFFDRYGKPGKLMKEIELFESLYNKKNGETVPKKMFKKDKLQYPEVWFRKYSKETEKQFNVLDMAALYDDLASLIDDCDLSVGEVIAAQMEYLGYIEVVDREAYGLYYVQDINAKYSPRITLYDLSAGESIVMKMSAKAYGENPFDAGDIVRLIETERRNKSMRQGDHWVKVIDEFDTWIKKYIVVSRKGENNG